MLRVSTLKDMKILGSLEPKWTSTLDVEATGTFDNVKDKKASLLISSV